MSFTVSAKQLRLPWWSSKLILSCLVESEDCSKYLVVFRFAMKGSITDSILMISPPYNI